MKRRPSPKSSHEKVQAHRKQMRAKGARIGRVWLVDTRSPEFIARGRREALAIANSPTEKEDQAFIDSASWWTSKKAEAFWEAEASLYDGGSDEAKE
jgi:hypothetical protein